MNHEASTHIAVEQEANDYDGEVAVHRQIGAVAISEVPGFSGTGAITPGERVGEVPTDDVIPVDSTDRILEIPDQSKVTVDPSKVFGHPAQLQRLEDQANEIRSNLR